MILLAGNQFEMLDPFTLLFVTKSLKGEGRIDELHSCLAWETYEQRNAWYEAQEAHGQIRGYVADINCAWRLAEKHGEEEQNTEGRRKAIGLQFRYALISASINSLPVDIPLNLFKLLVENKVWSLIQGLVYINRISTEDLRVTALIALAPQLPKLSGISSQEVFKLLEGEEDKDRRPLVAALRMALDIQDANQRARALVELVTCFPQSLMDVILNYVQDLPDLDRFGWDSPRLKGLIGIAPYLPKPLLQEVLTTVQGIWAYSQRLLERALIELAPCFAKQGDVVRALRIVHQTEQHTKNRVVALVRLLPHLSEPLQSQVLDWAVEEVSEIYDDFAQAEAYALLIRYLPEHLLPQAVARAQSIRDSEERYRLLTCALPRLPESLRNEVLQSMLSGMQEFHNDHKRANALAAMIPHVPDHFLEGVLAIVQYLKEARARTLVLVELAPRLPEPLLQDAFTLVKSDLHRAQILAAAAPQLSESFIRRVLAQLLLLRPSLRNSSRAQSWLLKSVDMAKKLQQKNSLTMRLAPKRLRQHVQFLAQAITYEPAQVIIIEGLIPYLSESLLKQTVVVAKALKDEKHQLQILTALLPRLPEPLRQEVFEQALTVVKMRRKEDKAQALTALAVQRPQPERNHLLRQALVAMQLIDDEQAWTQAVIELTPHLPKPVQSVVIQPVLGLVTGAEALGLADDRRQALQLLLPILVAQGQFEYLQEMIKRIDSVSFGQLVPRTELAVCLAKAGQAERALAIAQAINEPTAKVQALAKLTAVLPKSLQDKALQHALSEVQKIDNVGDKAQVLTILATHTSGSVRCDLIHQALVIKEKNYHRRIDILQKLTPFLSEVRLLEEMVSFLNERGVEHYYAANFLRLLIPYIPGKVAKQALSSAIISPGYTKDEVLTDLVMRFAAESDFQQALEIAQTITLPYLRIKMVARLLPNIPDQQREEIIEACLLAAQEINDESVQNAAFAHIVPYLFESLQSASIQNILTVQGQGPEYAVALAQLARHLPEPLREGSFKKALATAVAIREISKRTATLDEMTAYLPIELQGDALVESVLALWQDQDVHRSIVIADSEPFTLRLAQLPYSILYPAWCKLLRNLATQNRRGLLDKIRLLIPIINALGGAEAVAEAFSAIRDVGRWWPSESSSAKRDQARKEVLNIQWQPQLYAQAGLNHWEVTRI